MANLDDVMEELSDVFFDVDGFADSVTYIPQGVTANQFKVNANVDFANEEGSNQVRGEGRGDLNQARGRSTQLSISIDFPTKRRLANGKRTPMEINENGKDRVVVELPGTDKKVKLAVRRIVGRDEIGITVLCSKRTEHVAQRGVKE